MPAKPTSETETDEVSFWESIVAVGFIKPTVDFVYLAAAVTLPLVYLFLHLNVSIDFKVIYGGAYISLILTWPLLVMLRMMYIILRVIGIVKTLPEIAARKFFEAQKVAKEDALSFIQTHDWPGLFSQWSTIRAMGVVKNIDFVYIALQGLVWVSVIIVNKTTVGLYEIIPLTIGVVHLAIYVATIGFRTGSFVLRLVSELDIVPSEAVKLIIAYQNRP